MERIAEPRDIPIGQEFVEKARALVKSKYSENVIEPGHISLYKICLSPSDGKASKYSNGCRRKKPFEQWNVYLRVTPPSGDWFVKNVVFADELEQVVSDGPRGFFQ